MSPIPSIREASLSGWKTSSGSIFSVADENLTGTPVTARIASAAPPRASPSSFVRIRPVSGARRLNSRATLVWSCTRGVGAAGLSGL